MLQVLNQNQAIGGFCLVKLRFTSDMHRHRETDCERQIVGFRSKWQGMRRAGVLLIACVTAIVSGFPGSAHGQSPSISVVSPASGYPGMQVSIVGTSFGNIQGASTVTFGSTLATVISWSSSSITVAVPFVAAGTTNIVVTVTGLNSAPASFITTPHIASLSTTSGSPNMSVSIVGTDFGMTQGTSTVRFGSTNAQVTTWSATSIVVTVPNVDAGTTNVAVSVNNVDSAPAAFTITPNISSLSVSSAAPGRPVRIVGTGFGASRGASTVMFGSAPATISSWSATLINVDVPTVDAGATGIIVSVNGVDSFPETFTVTPSVGSLSAATGTPGSVVSIIGANFGANQGTSTVRFGPTTATVTSWSSSSISVVVPDMASGAASIIVEVNGVNSTSATFTVTPNITSLSAASGSQGTSLVIGGTNFGLNQGSSSVKFGSFVAPVTTWSVTSIVVSVPNVEAGEHNIVVSVNNVDSAPVAFTVTPNISSLSTSSASPGTSVTIAGTGFGVIQNSSTVKFGAKSVDVVTSWSPTAIVALVPKLAAGVANVVVSVGGVDSASQHFTVFTTIPIIANPGVIQPVNGKLPSSFNLTVAVPASTCDDQKGPNLSGSILVISGAGLTLSSNPVTVGKCSITYGVTVDPNAAAGTYQVSLLDANKNSLGETSMSVMDSTAGPIPPGLAPETDVMWEVMSQHNCADVFGKRISQTVYCIQLKIGNNSGYALQIAGIGFSSQLEYLTGAPKITIANSSYASTRAVLLTENVTSGRNIAYNMLQATGVVMTAFTPYFGTGKHPNGTVNNARTNWTTAASIVSGPLLSAFNIVAPNSVITQLNNLDDQSFRDNRVIPNNTHIQTVVFVEKRALTYQLAELSKKYPELNKLIADGSEPDAAKINKLLNLSTTVKNSTNPNNQPFSWRQKGEFSPLLVKLALGNVVIVGDKIKYLERVQIQSNANPSSTPVPLNATPSSLTFSSQAVLSSSAEQVVTFANTGSSPLTNLVAKTDGANKDDFAPANNKCSSTLGASATCTISVVFTPTAKRVVDRVATLQVSFDGASKSQSVSLAGTASMPTDGVAVSSLAPDALKAALGQSGTATLTIGNVGNSTLTFTPPFAVTNPEFVITDNSCTGTLPSEQTCSMTITFKPAVSGAHTGILTIGYNTGGSTATKPINLSGKVQ